MGLKEIVLSTFLCLGSLAGNTYAQEAPTDVPPNISFVDKKNSDRDDVKIEKVGDGYVPKLTIPTVTLNTDNAAFKKLNRHVYTLDELTVMVSDKDPGQKGNGYYELNKPVTDKKGEAFVKQLFDGNYQVLLLAKNGPNKYIRLGAHLNRVGTMGAISFDDDAPAARSKTAASGAGSASSASRSGVTYAFEYSGTRAKRTPAPGEEGSLFDVYKTKVPKGGNKQGLVDAFEVQCPEYDRVDFNSLTDSGAKKIVGALKKDQLVFLNTPAKDSRCIPSEKKSQHDSSLAGGSTPGGSGAGSATGVESDSAGGSSIDYPNDSEEKLSRLDANLRLFMNLPDLETRFNNAGLRVDGREFGATGVLGYRTGDLMGGVLVSYAGSTLDVESLRTNLSLGKSTDVNNLLAGLTGRLSLDNELDVRLVAAYLRDRVGLNANGLNMGEQRDGLVLDAIIDSPAVVGNKAIALAFFGDLYLGAFNLTQTLSNTKSEYGWNTNWFASAGPSVHLFSDRLKVNGGLRVDSEVDTSLKSDLDAKDLERRSTGNSRDYNGLNADNKLGTQLVGRITYSPTTDLDLGLFGVTNVTGSLAREALGGFARYDFVRVNLGYTQSRVNTRSLGDANQGIWGLNVELVKGDDLLNRTKAETSFPR